MKDESAYRATFESTAEDWMPGAGNVHRLSHDGWASGGGAVLHAVLDCQGFVAGQGKAANDGKDTYRMSHVGVAEACKRELRPCQKCWPPAQPGHVATIKEAWKQARADTTDDPAGVAQHPTPQAETPRRVVDDEAAQKADLQAFLAAHPAEAFDAVERVAHYFGDPAVGSRITTGEFSGIPCRACGFELDLRRDGKDSRACPVCGDNERD